jgi:8-amino-7-oxononanoate synthase
MSDPLDWIDEESAAWAARGLKRSLRPVGRDGLPLLNVASNNYLALAHDKRVLQAALVASFGSGWGAGASPLISGWTREHEALVEDLAAFERTEAAVLFPTGYAANLGTIASLVGKPDAIYSDRLNHACLIDGSRLSGATVRVYPHNDVEALVSNLDADRGRFRRSLIVTDGVFGMDGDLAPLDQLAALADRYGAMLLVDEAHGTGVFGPDGRGAAAELGVADRVAVKVGTLSKSLGSVGGFVAGSRRLIDWLVNHARPLIFSTAAPAATVAAAREALRISVAEPWRRERARALGDRLRVEIARTGFEVIPATGPIVAVVLGEASAALALSARLEDRGFLVPAIRPPTVPEGTSRLRLVASAGHSDDQIEALIVAFRKGHP